MGLAPRAARPGAARARYLSASSLAAAFTSTAAELIRMHFGAFGANGTGPSPHAARRQPRTGGDVGSLGLTHMGERGGANSVHQKLTSPLAGTGGVN